MGANLANEIADEKISEATIGCDNPQHGNTLKQLFHTPYFRISVCNDREAVEICGALKVRCKFLQLYNCKQKMF